jgi:uncharacterized protein (TIGR03435 family)
MTERAASKLQFPKKLLLHLAGILTVAALAFFAFVETAGSLAQAPAQPKPQGIEGTWQGTLHAGRDLRTVVKISKGDDGGYKALFFSIDQGGDGLPVTKITLDGHSVKMTLTMIGGSYDGVLSSDGNAINGSWSQGPSPLPLNFVRATPETEWTIPPPAPKLPPMSADANPSFEVATIKPSPPNRPGKGFGFPGDHFMTRNTNVNDLIAFAYGLHAKQIIDAPPWFDVDLYDIEAKPDTEGRPNQKQMQIMVQKLLTERFQLKFHHDKRELSVYVITAGEKGTKLTATTSGPNDPSAFFFRALGDLTVRNQSMAEFATWMQSGVMDKPVVDQTGLTGKYDFQLKWTPDESQFGQFRGTGAVVPPPSNDANAPPSLYTAIQEQLGLKMGPGKVPDDVIVIDHVEKPSEN